MPAPKKKPAPRKPSVTVARPPKAEVFRGDGIQPWRFRLLGRNGEIMAVSEGYWSRWNARRAAKRAFGVYVDVVNADD